MEAVQQIINNQVMDIAKTVEDQLDEKLHKLDNMTEDDLDKVRQKRMEAMKRQAAKRAEWLANGHGEYNEIPDEKAFFKEMKGEERMVCHFYRENWPCKVMDKHLQEISRKHIETKFVKINAEKSPYLTDKLKIWMLPTLALIKNEKVIDYVIGFNELGGTDAFPQEYLVARLANSDVLNHDESARPPPASTSSGPRNVRQSTVVRQLDSDDEDSDFDD